MSSFWCLWKYVATLQNKVLNKGACPCHGSMYDPVTGKAIAGYASLQSPPSNVLPILNLETDSSGNLWIKPATWNVNKNGIVGFGRILV